MSSLVACPSCACHVARTETTCPHCGLDLGKSETGSVARTAGAVVLGLAVAAAGTQLGACGDDVQSDYGAGASVPEGGGGAGGGEGGAVQSDYGAASSE